MSIGGYAVTVSVIIDGMGPYIRMDTGNGNEHWTFRFMSSGNGYKPNCVYYDTNGDEVRRWAE